MISFLLMPVLLGLGAEITPPTDLGDEICIYSEGELDGEINEPTMTYVGEYEFTAYTATGNRCADGNYPVEHYTAASNDKKLWHKWIYVEGVGNVYVHDTGGMPTNVIDIYMNSYNACIQFGRRTGSVYYVD